MQAMISGIQQASASIRTSSNINTSRTKKITTNMQNSNKHLQRAIKKSKMATPTKEYFADMERHNVFSTDIHTSKRRFEYWRLLALFVALFSNGSLMVTASAAGNRVDSSIESVKSVEAVTAGGTSSFPEGNAHFVQLPHTFRHQEHYSRRIEHAVNYVKRTQLQQQLSGNYSHSTANIANDSGKSDNKYFHFQSQSQPQMSEHLRHHTHTNSLAPATALERYVLPPLRHQRHQQQDQHGQETAAATAVVVTSLPSIHRVKLPAAQPAVEGNIAAITNEHVKIPSTIAFHANSSNRADQHKNPHRYFDRDGLYQSPYLWTTKGPKVRVNKHDWTKNDFAATHRQNIIQTDSQRISLNLNAGSENIYKEVERNASSEKKYNFNSDMIIGEDYDSRVAEDDMGSRSEYDDYEYDDPEEEGLNANEFPNTGGMSEGERRVAVKRYTNIFNDLRLPLKKHDYPHLHSPTRQRPSKDRSGDENKIYANVAADSDDNNSDADFSSETWQHIEQEHNRKQLERQQQMLALRARHDNNYRSTEAVATAAPTALYATKQQHNGDDEDSGNVNSKYYIPGTLTRHKQEELGTLAAVKESQRSHVNKHKHEKALAGEHVKQILNEAACRAPQRRVERIQRDPSKMYMPHCTVVHRCTDETGCCRSERQTCAPKHTKNVDLYFYVRSINEKRGTVERLTFINHTECHCVEKSRQQADEYHVLSMPGISYGGQTIRLATILDCNCPKLYEKILQEDGLCRCDCSSGNTGCDWLKRGMEHFSMIDRKCISEGRCKLPTCEHGPYIKKYGRCPRRGEQLPAALTLTGSVMLATNALSGSDYH